MHEVERYTAVNDLGTATLMQVLLERPVRRLVVASSKSVYGEGRYLTASGEVCDGAERDPERIRAGEWEPRHGAGGPLRAVTGKPVTVFGDGSQTRSFCYVTDLAAALLALMDSADDVTGPVNLGNPTELPVLALARKIVLLTGSTSKVEFLPLPMDDPKRRQPVIERARSLLGWTPRVSLGEGLAATIDDLARRLQRSGQPISPSYASMALQHRSWTSAAGAD